MKNNKGFIDPVSLGFLISIGLATIGVTTDKGKVAQEQLAQDSQIQTEITVPAEEKPST